MKQPLVLQKMLFPFSQERLVLVSANIVICTVILLVFLLVGVAVLFPNEHSDVIEKECSLWGVDEALVKAVVWTESKFSSNAVSSAGAVGLMQLMPDTAYYLAEILGEDIEYADLKNASISVRLGVFYLSKLLQKFGNEKTALCAYNAGEGNVQKWIEQGVEIPFKETRDYVKRVLAVKKIYELRDNLTLVWQS